MSLLEPPHHEIVPLPGGRATLRERATGQSMHSLVGPIPEAREVFVAQSDLERGLARAVAEHRPWVLWDMGMGVAANAVATLERVSELARTQPLPEIQVLSFESDVTSLEWVLDQAQSPEPSAAWAWVDPWVEILRAALTLEGFRGPSPAGFPLAWRILQGDVLTRLTETPPAFAPADVIHWDLYSPAHSRRLWQPSVWRTLAQHLRPDGRLVTYSAATWVRIGMLLGGLCIARGRATELKKETTLAALAPHALSPTPVLPRTWMEDKLLYSTDPWPEEASDRSAARRALDHHIQWSLGGIGAGTGPTD